MAITAGLAFQNQQEICGTPSLLAESLSATAGLISADDPSIKYNLIKTKRRRIF